MQLSFSCISNLRFIPKSPKNPFFKVHLKLETWNLGVDCVFPWDKLMSDQDQGTCPLDLCENAICNLKPETRRHLKYYAG